MADDKGFTLWFTGLSGAGKSTISELVQTEIRSRRDRLEILDGDVVRDEPLHGPRASRRRTATSTSAASPSSPTCSPGTASR